jgi:hypothetical protein
MPAFAGGEEECRLPDVPASLSGRQQPGLHFLRSHASRAAPTAPSISTCGWLPRSCGIQTPRWEDSFLIISLGAIFFPFALHQDLYQLIGWLQQTYPHGLGQLPSAVLGSLLFFGLIFLFQLGYYVMVQIQARLTRVDRALLLPLLGYGFIPIILGVYLAVHFEIFVSQSWRLVANIREILAMAAIPEGARLISPDASALLQVFTVAGGFFASLYATHRIVDRLKGGGVTTRDLVLPYSFLAGFTILFVFFMKTSKIILF